MEEYNFASIRENKCQFVLEYTGYWTIVYKAGQKSLRITLFNNNKSEDKGLGRTTACKCMAL